MNDQNNNSGTEREVYVERGSDGGNSVAIVALLIIAVLVIGGAIFFFRGAPAEEPGIDANVDINLPTGNGGNGGDSTQ